MPRSALRMPKMSMTMEEGELIEWRVSPGEHVDAGQVVCEVLTDKVDMEVESTVAGTVLELVAEPGAVVPVGEPLAWLEATAASLVDDLLAPDPTPDAAVDDVAVPDVAVDDAAVDDAAVDDAVAPAPAPSRVRALLGARRIAEQHSLDLATVRGSGPDGAVMVSDVRRQLAAEPAGTAPPSAPAAVLPATRPATGPVTDLPVAAVAPGLDLLGTAGLGTAGLGLQVPASATVWAEVVLGAGPADPDQTCVALVAALAGVLGGRVGLLVETSQGPVTLSAPPGPGARDALREAVAQARAGRVEVRFLGVAEVVVSALPAADRFVPQLPAGALLAVGVGGPAARPVVVGGDLAVRTVVSLSGTADPRRLSPETVALLLRVASESLRVNDGSTQQQQTAM